MDGNYPIAEDRRPDAPAVNIGRLPRPTSSPAPVRPPPHNSDIEQQILGAILVDNRAYDAVSEFLRAEYFYIPAHARIYDAIEALRESGKHASPAALKGIFDQDKDLTELGGSGYLLDLVESVVTIVNVPDYGRQIVDLHLRRQTIALAQDAIDRAYVEKVGEQGKDVIAAVAANLDALMSDNGADKAGVRRFKDTVARFLASIDPAAPREVRGKRILTGLASLDRRLGGFHIPSLVVIGARPSMGKTALVTTILANVVDLSVERTPALLFSIEQKAEDIVAKIIARKTAIAVRTMRSGAMLDVEFKGVIDAARKVANFDLYIDDDSGIGIHQIRARARRLKRQDPALSVVAIDYLQLIESGDGENEERRLSQITKALKRLAKELDVCVILLSQLSRRVEERDNKRPLMADLRGSGSIEQDADVILFPYRHEYYLEHDKPNAANIKKKEAFATAMADWQAELDGSRGQAELHVAKARDAERGVEHVRFDGVRQVFEDFAGETMI